MIYEIQKNAHFSTPRTPKAFVRQVNGTAAFIDAEYKLPANDQLDWNKLTGISFNPLNPSRNAIMIGWRWNPTIEKVQLCAYFNVNGTNQYPENSNTPLINVGLGQLVSFEINYERVIIRTLTEKIIVGVPREMWKSFITSFRIQPYFGGNQSATSLIKIALNYE